MKYLNWWWKLTLATVLLVSCSVSIYNKPIREWMLKRLEQRLEKKAPL